MRFAENCIEKIPFNTQIFNITGKLVFLAILVLFVSACNGDFPVPPPDPPNAQPGSSGQPPSAEPEPSSQPPSAGSAPSAEIPDGVIDIVFVPEKGYFVPGESADCNEPTFVADTIAVRTNGLFENMANAHNQVFFQYLCLPDSGTIVPPVSSSQICPTVTWPDLSLVAYGDVFFMLHRIPNLRDCATGNRATASATVLSALVHESGHSAFQLPDEYCCDGAYWNAEPTMYYSQTSCNGDSSNSAWRDCKSIISSVTGVQWWRSEDTIADIMTVLQPDVPEHGQGDWEVIEVFLSSLGGSGVTSPTVFAPSIWP